MRPRYHSAPKTKQWAWTACTTIRWYPMTVISCDVIASIDVAVSDCCFKDVWNTSHFRFGMNIYLIIKWLFTNKRSATTPPGILEKELFERSASIQIDLKKVQCGGWNTPVSKWFMEIWISADLYQHPWIRKTDGCVDDDFVMADLHLSCIISVRMRWNFFFKLQSIINKYTYTHT